MVLKIRVRITFKKKVRDTEEEDTRYYQINGMSKRKKYFQDTSKKGANEKNKEGTSENNGGCE